MKVKLKEIYILEEKIASEDAVFKTLIDNSYREWNEKWKLQNLEREEIGWKATFQINYEGNIGEFIIDTEGEQLTHLDLEGYLGGESFVLDDDIHLKVASRSSGILTALYFSEAVKYNLLKERVEKALYYTIFPEWSRGLVPEGVDNLSEVQKFLENFKKPFGDLEILKEIEIDLDSYDIVGGNGVLKEAFKNFAKEYFNNEIFFFIHDTDYIGSLKILEEVAKDFDIDTSIIEDYE